MVSNLEWFTLSGFLAPSPDHHLSQSLEQEVDQAVPSMYHLKILYHLLSKVYYYFHSNQFVLNS
jgi:hypothetical protein